MSISIRDLSFTSAVQIDKNCSPRKAALVMCDNNCDCVVVTQTSGDDSKPKPIGIITERDLAIFMLDDVSGESNTTVGELLNGILVTISERDSTSRAVELMNKYSIHNLPVTRSDGSLAGILTVDDLISHLAHFNTLNVDWPSSKRYEWGLKDRNTL